MLHQHQPGQDGDDAVSVTAAESASLPFYDHLNVSSPGAAVLKPTTRQHNFIAINKCQMRFHAAFQQPGASLSRAITKVLHIAFFRAASLDVAAISFFSFEVLRGSHIQ
jgi:hypothetical protein